MENPESENFLIGSDFEGSEGMFQAPPEGERLNQEAIDQKRRDAEVIPDAQERFEKILEERGWTLVQEPIAYPTLNEWVDFRIEHGRGTKFYPCFVEDVDGNVNFVKFQLSNKPEHLEELKHEAVFLTDEKSPTDDEIGLIEYQPENEESSAFLCARAIPFSEGRVVKASEFSKDNAENTVKKIKELEETPIDSLSQEVQNLPSFQAERTPGQVMEDLVARAQNQISNELEERIINQCHGEELKEVLVHGDARLKNIVCKKDGQTVFVDWGTCAKGFLGQDAAKFLLDVWRSEEVGDVVIQAYTHDQKGDVDKERARGLLIGVVISSLVHIVWRVEEDIPKAQELMAQYQEEESLGQEQRDKCLQEQEAIIKQKQDEIRAWNAEIELALEKLGSF